MAYDERARLRSSDEKKRYTSFNQEKRFKYYDVNISFIYEKFTDFDYFIKKRTWSL